ncbi:MAG: DUF1257 domain-containing protein [Acidobacteria bacterium]|jgi:hypothetical protein|nr:DUF1257 domain-containing protein [Acidobacteriota bacterium]
MSKYMAFTDSAFKDRECLLNALSECGYSEVEEGEALSLYGYQGDRRPETAQLVVRRKFIGSASNDLGFQKTDAGYVPVISEFDQRTMMSGKFLTNLRTNYNLKSAEKLARSLRGTLHQERIGSTIKIRIKY